MAVRLALEHKGIPYKRVDLPAGMHPLFVRAYGFRGDTVPALQLDGVGVQGSVEIIRHLERIKPDPALYPKDPGRRAAVEQAEHWGERELQPIPRRVFRYLGTTSPEVRRWFAADSVPDPIAGAFAPAVRPISKVMARKVGADEATVRADVEGLPATLDRVDALIATGTIGAATPNAADFQIFSTILSLASFSDLEPFLAGRPCLRIATTIAPPMPGPVPAAIDRAWLDRAQDAEPAADRV